MRLKNKVTFITGGGQGIGRATALLFAREGGRVVVADINKSAADSVAAEIIAADGQALAVQVDVSRAESVEAAVAEAIQWGSRIDVLLNNAGITRDARLPKMTEAQWDAVINVNLKGVWLCGRAIAPHMIAQGSGSIINVSSIVGLYGNFGQSNYAATKAGVIAMAQTWARELGPSGVRSNAVAPGFIATELTTTIPEKITNGIKERTPLRRFGQPEELAQVYLFLASDDSSYINGTVIAVDGGLVW
ncbi:MAG: beta-ketoacyl-ACP reductase [Roseiflexaceae bacterium]|nr:beta-ketoacyl-ACP reductase [Roseiflexaceae bacterium]